MTDQIHDNPASTPAPAEVPVTCPKCGHSFWHKISHALGKVGEAALEVVANVLQPGVPK